MSKLAVFMIFRPSETDATGKSLRHISAQLGRDARAFVLCNGEIGGDPLEELRSVSPNVSVFVAGRNLGVAGGRNEILKRIFAEWDPEILVSLDNDLVVPPGYFEVVRRIFNDPANADLGVAAPVLVQAPVLGLRGLEDYLYPDSATLMRRIEEAYVAEGRSHVIFHSGVRNWRRHYIQHFFALPRSWRRWLEPLHRVLASGAAVPVDPSRSAETFLGSDTDFIRSWMSSFTLGRAGLLSVDVLPGGVHCFRQDLLDRIGMFDERFSPFGYEDVDFCIRAALSGRRNVLIGDAILIHDICRRFVGRDDFQKWKIGLKSLFKLTWKYSDRLPVDAGFLLLLFLGRLFRLAKAGIGPRAG